jgi:flagellar biosynthesis/type III secretory pathway M-ring protein FliF/YscJ
MLGRFKANVKIAYGEGKQQASLFDTEQFFMVPFKIVILLLIAIIVFSLLITYLLRRAFYDEQHEEDDDSLPLYIRNDREHETKDHDIHLTKN